MIMTKERKPKGRQNSYTRRKEGSKKRGKDLHREYHKCLLYPNGERR